MSITNRLLSKSIFCDKYVINHNYRRWKSNLLNPTVFNTKNMYNLNSEQQQQQQQQQQQKRNLQQFASTQAAANIGDVVYSQQYINNNTNCCYGNDNNNMQFNNNNNNFNSNDGVAADPVPVISTVATEIVESGRSLINGVNTIKSSSSSNSSLNAFKLNRSFLTKNNNLKQIDRKMSTSHKPIVQADNINPNIVKMEYAVRGPLVIRAGEIEKELKAGQKKPFDEVIRANIGDCHAMGQQPITFIRQVLALTVQPSLFKSPEYPEDVKKHAKEILEGCQGQSLGSYSDSAGIEIIRRQCANYIEQRDGFPSDWSNVILTAGASQGIKGLLSLLRCEIDGKTPGVLVPIPQYPLYSATIAEFDMHQCGYYLDEANNWGLQVSELQRCIDESKKSCNPRVIVIINPGNPTGQVLTYDNIKEIIKFAHRERLVVFADEVYQDNVYDKNSKFHSFKKVLMEMGEPYNKMELASFMSCSKGYMGECGIRGGYSEIINFDPEVKKMFLKSISAQLCPTTIGQATISCVVNPPKPGDPSYERFNKEKTSVLSALKERAELVYKTFNSFEGFSCNVVQGAMYAFPQFKLPPKAIEAAKKAGKAPDVFYAFELLENTGICIVPGTGFGQQPGTHHFRTTILPQTDKLKVMLNKFQKFHLDFMSKYK